MARKRKTKKRPYTPPAPKAAPAAAEDAPAPKTSEQRRANREEARRARERAVRSMRRRSAMRRALTIVVIGGLVAALFFFLTRVGRPSLSEEALAAASAAGCSGLEEQPDRGRSHEGPYAFEDRPATSGPHDPNPAAAGVYTEPQDEAQVVHAMEHGYAVIYYRADGEDALDGEIVDALATAVEDEGQVIMAPHANLPDGVAVAYAAWTYLMTCPGGIEADQATAIATGWIEGLRDARTAPEANVD